MYIIITSEQSEWSSYYQSFIGRLDNIQTAIKPLQKSEKIIINFHENFRANWIVKTMNQPDPIQLGLPSLSSLTWNKSMTFFSETIKDRDVKCWHNLYSSVTQISVCVIEIWNNFQQQFLAVFFLSL